jgi:hypothetical protein
MGVFKFVLLLRNLHVPLCGKCFDSCKFGAGCYEGVLYVRLLFFVSYDFKIWKNRSNYVFFVK